jgi:hypothetical protein
VPGLEIVGAGSLADGVRIAFGDRGDHTAVRPAGRPSRAGVVPRVLG